MHEKAAMQHISCDLKPENLSQGIIWRIFVFIYLFNIPVTVCGLGAVVKQLEKESKTVPIAPRIAKPPKQPQEAQRETVSQRPQTYFLAVLAQ